MTVTIQQLVKTLGGVVESQVPERVPGYKAAVAGAIADLLAHEKAYLRQRTTVNPQFLNECKKLGEALGDKVRNQES